MSFLHHAFGDEHGVFVVVTAPGHEGDEHVFAEARPPSWMAGPSASTSPFLTICPGTQEGTWPKQEFWFDLWNFSRS